MKSCLLELHDDGLVRGGVHDVLTTQVNVRTRHDGFVGHLKTILFYNIIMLAQCHHDK